MPDVQLEFVCSEADLVTTTGVHPPVQQPNRPGSTSIPSTTNSTCVTRSNICGGRLRISSPMPRRLPWPKLLPRAYNPLYLYGGVGMGKTHLMQAIGHLVKTRNPALRLTYISAEKFTNEVINSLRFDRMITFRDRFR